MKKSLIALAALAVVSAASAQSTLVIDGYLDRGYVATNNKDNTKDAKGVASNAGTTTVGIKGSEDLGGGLKAGFSINTDWAEAAGQTQGGTAPTPAQSGFANSQSFLELSSAQLGSLRLGNPNNEVLGAVTSVASPAFSTGVGSAYSSTFSIHNGYGSGKTGANNQIHSAAISDTSNAGVRGIRQSNTIKYISPNFSGFSAVYGFSSKNDNAGGTVNTVGVQDMSLSYANGPVQVVYASIKSTVGANTLPANDSGLTAGASNTNSILGASYQVLPNVKLHAGLGKSTSSLAAYNSTSTQFGVTYDLSPVIAVMAQVASVNDKSTTNIDRKLVGLGVDYKFSKTTRAYVRYDSVNLNSSRTTAAANEQTRTAIGVSKAF